MFDFEYEARSAESDAIDAFADERGLDAEDPATLEAWTAHLADLRDSQY